MWTMQKTIVHIVHKVARPHGRTRRGARLKIDCPHGPHGPHGRALALAAGHMLAAASRPADGRAPTWPIWPDPSNRGGGVGPAHWAPSFGGFTNKIFLIYFLVYSSHVSKPAIYRT